jgi:hypothetical protein
MTTETQAFLPMRKYIKLRMPTLLKVEWLQYVRSGLTTEKSTFCSKCPCVFRTILRTASLLHMQHQPVDHNGRYKLNTVKLGYNVMKGTEYFVSL